jgi:hypothetical protein
VTGRIAILHHEADRGRPQGPYLLEAMAAVWQAEGWEVLDLYGAADFIPADLAIMHVDVSEVPQPYLELAARYPKAINGTVKDIRKSAYSPHLLRQGDGWEGAVIVKSDRNFGGWPEAVRQVPRAGGLGLAPAFRSPDEYRLYSSLAAVPPEVFSVPDVVVQGFVPEYEDDLYHVRAYTFFGDAFSSTRIASEEPIVKYSNRVSSGPVPVHPDIVALRHRLGFGYGKFDYVVREGRAILLDANKTPGLPTPNAPRSRALAAKLAAGLLGLLGVPQQGGAP